MDRRGEDVDLADDVKAALCRQIFEATSYFEVLVVQVAFVKDTTHQCEPSVRQGEGSAFAPGQWNLLLGLSCELGEKDCVIPFTPTARGLTETPALIRAFVGDWTA